MLRKFGVALAGLLLGAASAAPILAVTSTAGAATTVGNVEICKYASPTSPIPVKGSFTFTVTNSAYATTGISVPVNGCTGEIPVTASSVTVTETSVPGNAVSAITESPGGSYLSGISLPGGSVTVAVSPTTVSTVNFFNTVVTGYVEVCKAQASNDVLTGAWNFALSDTNVPGFAASTTVNVGACSDPILVPAGTIQVAEQGSNLNVTNITAVLNGGSTSELTAHNLVAGTASATVVASANSSQQTDITFTNASVGLKVCKVFDTVPGAQPTPAPSYPFSFAFASSNVAGPDGPAAGISLTAGTAANPNCSFIGSYRAGTTVTITEGPVAGTKVESIATDGVAESVLPGSPNTLNGTETITLGTPTNSGLTAPGNEAVITYTDQAAAPGTLKICKIAGTPAPIGNSFNFTVSGVSGSTNVPVGQCAFVGGSTPNLFPFNSVVTITETPSTGNAVSAISAIPQFVTETGGATSEAVLQSSSLTAGTASVVIGEGDVTEVSYTNIDPPVPSGPTTTVVDPGGIGVTVGATPGIASTVSGSIPGLVSSSTGSTVEPSSTGALIVPPSVAVTSLKSLTPKERAALLKKDTKSLANVKSAITHWTNLLKHTKSALLRKTIDARLMTLRSERNVLNLQISLLKK